MLVLSRKKNESIIINDDITIVVVEIRGDKVRLGVEAPKEVPVHRNEVYEAIRRNQQKSDESDSVVAKRRLESRPINQLNLANLPGTWGTLFSFWRLDNC